MTTGKTLLSTMLLLAVLCLALGPVLSTSAWSPFQQDGGQTEDILYLRDGRVFKGRVLSEDGGQIVFEYHDRNVNVKAKLTFRQDQVAKLLRGVPVADAPEKPDTPEFRRGATSQPDAEKSGPS